MKTVKVPETAKDCVGLAIVDWRARLGLNQVAGCTRLGISQATLSRVERGGSSVDLDLLLGLPRVEAEFIVERMQHWAHKVLEREDGS